MFDDLADELLARWPAHSEDQGAARRGKAIRWAKLHEPAKHPLSQAT